MSEPTRDVLVYRTMDGPATRYMDAFLQADDATILIRQKVDGCWTTTAVYAPGKYEFACYDGDGA